MKTLALAILLLTSFGLIQPEENTKLPSDRMAAIQSLMAE